MLVELAIKDFALIDQVNVPFTKGLNVLTGETGAGKSIMLDAIDLVLGGKSSATMIRSGGEKLSVEASFKPSAEILAWLKNNQLLDGEDSQLIISREVSRSGSKARINGTLVNLALIQELRSKLFTIHSQHEARTLLSREAQLDLLDALGDGKHVKNLEKVRTLYTRYKELKAGLDELSMNEQERIRRLDFARFQLEEILEAKLSSPDEDVQIKGQLEVLRNVSALEQVCETAFALVLESDQGLPALSALERTQSELSKQVKADPRLEAVLENLTQGIGFIEDFASQLKKYRQSLETDPQQQTLLEERLNILAALKRKYGPNMDDVLSLRDSLEKEVEQLENADRSIEKLQNELKQIESDLAELALTISKRRKSMAFDLAKKIMQEIASLGMDKAKVEIAFEKLDSCGQSGIDRLEFLIAPNPGLPMQPIAKIASGGELSRVMLAIKTIFAQVDSVSCVVFDEIDTGLSGRVLNAVKEKMHVLSSSQQVICITHQPIIAAGADNYLQVEKSQGTDKTSIRVEPLNNTNDRIKALAAMASGYDNEASALDFARSLMSRVTA